MADSLLHITSGKDEAWISPMGAQVVRWTNSGRDMLWCASTRLEGKPLRGGIPICWPWFGSHPNDASLPSHGVARTRQFAVTDTRPDRVSMQLKYQDLEANVEVRVGNGLEVSLQTRNAGSQPAVIEAALHTYLSVDDIGDVSLEGLDGADYLDQLENRARRVQQGPVRFDGEVDRIYLSPEPVVVQAGGRAIEVDGCGSSGSTVVWNPWIDKSARLGDMSAGDYRRMVCVETGWIADDKRTIEPGGTQTLKVHLKAMS